MELLQNYGSTSEESFIESHNAEPELSCRQVRSVYLITYSQADLQKFPSRLTFANTLTSLFQTSKIKVVQWVCCIEDHQVSGVHYHMAVKLNNNKRWLPVKKKMFENFGVQLHFSSNHLNYYSAWKYVTKSDQEYLQSPNHPDLTLGDSPKTSQATRKRSRKRKQNEQKGNKNKKQKRLTNSMVSECNKNKIYKNKNRTICTCRNTTQRG